MSNIHNARTPEDSPAMPGRRNVLVAGLGLAAASMVAAVTGCAPIQSTATRIHNAPIDTRKIHD